MLSLYPEVTGKVVDLLPKAWEATAANSYAGFQRQGMRVRYYTPDDIRECHLATTICPSLATSQQWRRRS